MKTIGFVGLGLMGERMAANLLKKGFQVVVYNRTAHRAESLRALGARVAATPREVAQATDAFCTCVSDPQALRDVSYGNHGLLSGTRPGQLSIDFSTISVQLAQELFSKYQAAKCDFIDAPVTGSILGAERATLIIMAGASAELLARARPIFQALGEKTVHCGDVGAGTQVKLAVNLMIAAMLQSFSEALLLTSAAGVDPKKVVEVVQASPIRSPYFDFKGAAIFGRDFATNFSIDPMYKDLSLCLENAGINKVPTPVANALQGVYNLARSAGKGTLDIAAVVTALEDISGKKVGVQ